MFLPRTPPPRGFPRDGLGKAACEQASPSPARFRLQTFLGKSPCRPSRPPPVRSRASPATGWLPAFCGQGVGRTAGFSTLESFDHRHSQTHPKAQTPPVNHRASERVGTVTSRKGAAGAPGSRPLGIPRAPGRRPGPVSHAETPCAKSALGELQVALRAVCGRASEEGAGETRDRVPSPPPDGGGLPAAPLGLGPGESMCDGSPPRRQDRL